MQNSSAAIIPKKAKHTLKLRFAAILRHIVRDRQLLILFIPCIIFMRYFDMDHYMA